MIITECPHCDTPAMYMMSDPGVYAPQTCDDCGKEYVIEVTRIDGVTYTRQHFEEKVLPDLDVELVEHPDGDTELYADPDKLTWR